MVHSNIVCLPGVCPILLLASLISGRTGDEGECFVGEGQGTLVDEGQVSDGLWNRSIIE